MQTPTIQNNTQLSGIGKFISPEVFSYLTGTFEATHAASPHSLPVAKNVIEQVLKDDSISGIRFMYGITDLKDPALCMVLMPCGYDISKKGSLLPNITISKKGYFSDKGTVISFDDTWKRLFNYVITEYRKNPAVPIKEINRGVFWGRENLLQLIQQPDAAELKFYFGQSENAHIYPVGYHPVVTAVAENGKDLQLFLNHGELCPKYCDGTGGDGSCVATNTAWVSGIKDDTRLNVLRKFRDELWLSEDGYLVEQYYHTSPAITFAIDKAGNKNSVYNKLYSEKLKHWMEAIAANDNKGIKEAYKKTMDELADRFH